ncbi:MAG: GNAT family N-acetyltransferase [Clostridiales bacterium]|nr:GNAT family N-acetyltransferase [Clostridiales bacterium]
MQMIIRGYIAADLPAMKNIWNEVVRDGVAFPQLNELSDASAAAFFAEQSHNGVAEIAGEILGLYILHPNNVGRCGHIANASYAVSSSARGKHVGEALVRDSIKMGAALGFRIMQFNAVVATNAPAIHLYQKIGFTQLGTIPDGFHLKDGTYADIHPFYIEL